MNKKNLLSLGMLLIPWFSVPLLGKVSFVRFLPVTTFVNLFMSILSIFAIKNKWWKNKGTLFGSPINLPYMLGIFFVGTLWIFKLTYGKFVKYLLLNIVMDYILAFPFAKLATKVGVFEFKKMRPIVFFYLSVFLAVIIYGYQYIVEQVMKKITTKGVSPTFRGKHTLSNIRQIN
ncbi:hypothetical protein [Sporosarcina globispora]|uniref:hypothetical protein n=1 Tax=Sporosarcina globispora TaxID=1459 RepID=UPI0008409BDE|nr:hypothetical protein [Sporosarcina globispora]